jgi:hypothetical protein
MDWLKDMAGVLDSVVKMAADSPHDAHLMLVGPDVTGVTDDPEGAAVFAECRARWRKVPTTIRQRIHLASIPMDDVDENAIIINGLRRHASLIVQTSLVEGFGLTAGSDVEGQAGHRQPRRWHPGPDRRPTRRPADRRSLRPRCPRRIGTDRRGVDCIWPAATGS